MKIIRASIPGSAVSVASERITINRAYGGQTGVVRGFGKDLPITTVQLSGKDYLRVGRGRVCLSGIEVDISLQDIAIPQEYPDHTWGLYTCVDIQRGIASVVLADTGSLDQYTDTYIQVRLAEITVVNHRVTALDRTVGTVLTKREIFARYGYKEE